MVKMKICILVLLVFICVRYSQGHNDGYGSSYAHEVVNDQITFWILSSTDEKNWEEANTLCQTIYNGTLAILDTDSKRKQIRQQITSRPNVQDSWFGLQYVKTHGRLQWVNGDTANLDDSLYQGTEDNKCYFIKPNNAKFFKKDCNDELNGLICEVRSSTASQPGIHSTPSIAQTTEQTSATTDAWNSGKSSTFTTHHVVMTTSAAVSNIVQETPTPSSSSSMENRETSLMQSSSYMRTTSEINPAKTSSVQPSTTAMPTTSAFKNRHMIKEFHNFMKTLNTSNPNCMSDLLSNYSGLMNWIDEQDPKDIEYNPLADANDIENIALEFTKQHLSSKKKNMSIANKDIAFHAMHVDDDLGSDVIFPEASDPDVNTISLPKFLFKGQETYVVNVVYKNKKTIRQLTPTAMEGRPDDKNTWSVNTGIFSLTIFPKRKELAENVNITLHHFQKMKYAKPHCTFWNFSIPTNYSGSWSQHGCHVVSTTDTHTLCVCNHLTNFAVLMKLNDHEVPSIHKKALLVITYFGLGLSLLGEAITVLLYCFFSCKHKNLRHEKIQIRINLLCALAAAQVVFLAGIDKTENKDLCTFVASLLHLFYLVSFCWMLMEGVYLYRMVVQVFDAHITMRYSYIFAFGFPLCIIACSLITASSVQHEGIYSYLSSEYCWIRFKNGFIWSFVVPVLILIAINCFFLFRVLKEMASMKSVQNVNSLELSSIRASARACVVLLPLLGITWLFGLLSAVTTHVVWQYVFTILNAMQGFMIFVFHCLRNTELKAAMKLRYFQWESSHARVGNRSSTPSKFLTFDESDKSRSNSLPMATKVNQVMPEKQTSKA